MTEVRTETRTEARCIRECIWQGRRWRPGETYRGAETPPEHFELLPIPGGWESLPEEEKPRARRRKDAPAEAGERDDSPEAPEKPENPETGGPAAEKEE